MTDAQKNWRRDENDEDDEAEQELDEAVSRRESHLV
jgi:ATP-dependent DNA helicase 2 subunit 1